MNSLVVFPCLFLLSVSHSLRETQFIAKKNEKYRKIINAHWSSARRSLKLQLYYYYFIIFISSIKYWISFDSNQFNSSRSNYNGWRRCKWNWTIRDSQSLIIIYFIYFFFIEKPWWWTAGQSFHNNRFSLEYCIIINTSVIDVLLFLEWSHIMIILWSWNDGH